MRLHNRVFLLTGGTGGIGRELAHLLVGGGARVIVASRHPDAVERSSDLSAVYLDLAAQDLDEQLLGLSESCPDIDGVIHCAGQNEFAGVGQMTVAAMDQMVSVNLRSAMILARHFVPRFSGTGYGALVFVGSTFGSIGFPGYSAYCASKFGLRGFAEAVRRELADTPVQVVYVAPRATATGMNPETVNQLNRSLGNTMDPPDQVAASILDAMVRDERTRFLGWPEKLFVVLNGILPALVDRALLRQLPVIRRFLSPETGT